MPGINTEEVLNGTFHKQLYQGYQKMKLSGLTQESASEYKRIYEDAPLSDILKESSLIFGEPLKGLDFYTKIMCEKKIPLHQFRIQTDRLNEFITENADKMSNEMKTKYDTSRSQIMTVVESRKHEIEFSQFHLTEDVENMIDEMCNDLYEFEDAATIPSVESFFENASLENQILYGYYILQEYSMTKLSNILHKNMIITESTATDPEMYKNAARANVISTYLTEDSAIRRKNITTKNKNLHDIVCESVYENYGNVISQIFTEYHDDESEVTDYIGESAVMEMFEDDRRNEIMQSDFLDTRLANATKAKYILEAALDVTYTEYLNNDDDKAMAPSLVSRLIGSNMTIKESVDFLIEKVNQMDDIINIIMEDSDDPFFEYTRRGEATPTIRSQTGNVRENFQSSSGGNKKKEKIEEDDDDEEDDEDEIEEKNTAVKKNQPQQKNTQQNNEKPQETKQEEQNNSSNEEKTDPKLQKQSLTRKIQNKAIDADAKMQKAAGNVSQKVTELKNAGKAIMRLPNNILNKMKTTVEEWNTMDEEKRKERIIRPGYRTQIFKMLKTAIAYGAIWQWKKYMVIVAWICKHTFLHPFFKASKQRSERLRNELTAELETEIAVTEEKINDANANGDQKQKYELIRIKKKLEAEKVRVSTNSKYI